VGLDEQTIRDYIRDQQEEEKRQEQLPFGGLQPPSSPKKGLQPLSQVFRSRPRFLTDGSLTNKQAALRYKRRPWARY